VDYDKDNSIKSAKFKVSVNKSWLKANDVDPSKFSLYRYTTTWEELDTKILNEDGEDIYFEVTTHGFSYFSLGGANGSGYKPIKEKVAPTVTTTSLEPTTTTTPAAAPAPQVTTPPPVTKPPEEKGGICGPTVVVLLAMVVLAFRHRRMQS